MLYQATKNSDGVKLYSVQDNKHFMRLERSANKVKELKRNLKRTNSNMLDAEIKGTGVKVFTLTPREMKARGLKVYKVPLYSSNRNCNPKFKKMLRRSLKTKSRIPIGKLTEHFSQGDCELSFGRAFLVPIRATPSNENDWKDYAFIQTIRPVISVEYKNKRKDHPSDMFSPHLDVESFTLHGIRPASAYTKDQGEKITQNANTFLNGWFRHCILDDLYTKIKYRPLKDPS